MTCASSPSPDFLRLVPHEFARRHLVLSAGTGEGGERLLVAGSTRPAAAYNVGVRLGRPVVTEGRPAEEIAAAIDRAYRLARDEAAPQDNPAAPAIIIDASSNIDDDLRDALREAERDLLATHGKAPAVRLVDLILFEALQRGASDVHIQPLRQRTLVRYRLDGSLHTARELPGGSSMTGGLVGRIKVMASLDVAERRAPQDGRATVTIAGRRIDLRISTLPSTYGERVVLRLLDPARSPHLKSFAALGMPDPVRDPYLAQVSRTSGIVLSTGPTGSGKTTTLYATLAWISATNGGNDRTGFAEHAGASRTTASTNSLASPADTQSTSTSSAPRSLDPSIPRSLPPSPSCELNIMTIEDPVEYDLGGAGATAGERGSRGGGSGEGGLSISQTQVDPKKNVTFATGLRHILRQDPDVIMVGEIRDEETARIAVQASLTGHLVLSTLHTSDASSAVARLLDLGVEPFLVASSLSAVLAQRLVRTLHQDCGGAGCPACLGSGFKGRTGLFELLVLTPVLRTLVGERASASAIKDAARRPDAGGHPGMVTLREAGGALVARGLTTHAEVARVIDTFEEIEA